MARWRLTQPHYIHAKMFGQDNEWEYKETDRVTGRESRKRFVVPLYCESGWIVCREGSEQQNDNVGPDGKGVGSITFDGPPTPAMEPLDAEAQAINAEHAHEWIHPIDSLPGTFSSADLLTMLQKQVANAASITPPAPVVAQGVSKEEFEALKEQLAQLMAQNAELMARPKSHSDRRRV